jgi:hypothetical protein
MAVSDSFMELITVDGGYRVSNETERSSAIGILYPGERIDVVLDRTSQHVTSEQKSSTNLTIELDAE